MMNEAEDCLNTVAANRKESNITMKCIAPNNIDLSPTPKEAIKERQREINLGDGRRRGKHKEAYDIWPYPKTVTTQ
jgi:hypothetical protein